MTPSLTPSLAARLAAMPLGHVVREYPNKLDHVMGGPADVASPRALHPVFFGSYDWHSCVHGWWSLFTLYRLHPDMAEAPAIRALADDIFTPANMAGETAYLRGPDAPGFERPYGWAWLLMLAAELDRHETEEGRRWAETLRPLAEAFADWFKAFLPRSPYPVRVGAHANTAFALRLALEYDDPALVALCREKALAWYGRDRACPAWEPCQEDFLSPALIEVELMRAVLPREDFLAWLDAFLPDLAEALPATLFEPPVVTDRTDGKIAHLDGLCLSRAWCWRGLASALPEQDPRRPLALAAAQRHLSAAMPHLDVDYMGEHWLASFVLLALTEGSL